MIYLEGIKTKVTMAVMLKDELSPDERTIGDVFIRVSGIRKKPVKHSSGYFFLLDAPDGTYQITAYGRFYKEETLTINPSSLQPVLLIGSKPTSPKLPVAEIKLTRK